MFELLRQLEVADEALNARLKNGPGFRTRRASMRTRADQNGNNSLSV
jgi:hypothetical protein